MRGRLLPSRRPPSLRYAPLHRLTREARSALVVIPGKKPTKAQVTLLTRFLASPEQPEGTLRFPELRGFLFAIASAPILVQPSEWIPQVFGGAGPSLRDLEHARAVMAAIMACYNDAVRAAHLDGPIDPREVGIDVGSEDSLRAWSRGFVVGVESLDGAWDPVLETDGSDERRLELAFTALTIWANPEGARRLYQSDDEALAEMHDKLRRLLPLALGLVAGTGRGIYEGTLARRTETSPRRPTAAAGRNDPCPCGSGRKYKDCCLRIH